MLLDTCFPTREKLVKPGIHFWKEHNSKMKQVFMCSMYVHILNANESIENTT